VHTVHTVHASAMSPPPNANLSVNWLSHATNLRRGRRGHRHLGTVRVRDGGRGRAAAHRSGGGQKARVDSNVERGTSRVVPGTTPNTRAGVRIAAAGRCVALLHPARPTVGKESWCACGAAAALTRQGKEGGPGIFRGTARSCCEWTSHRSSRRTRWPRPREAASTRA
jgi:hypothetical protein